MRKVIFCCFLLVMFSVSGCVVRTYTTQMDRVDQEVYGNGGYIMGTRPYAGGDTTEGKRTTREIYNVEIELPSRYMTDQEAKLKGKATDKDLYGNRGYVQGRVVPEKEVYVSDKGGERASMENEKSSSRLGSSRMPQIVYSEPSASGGAGTNIVNLSGTGSAQKEYYIVQKGDTLQKISERFFGTTRKWDSIYKANKHILKSPDSIRPGQKLVIPKE